MLAKLYTACLLGLDCKIVEVEVDYRKGNSYFSIVGLADKSVQEAKDRIPPAIRNTGAEFIPMQIVINLAPAELAKSGPSYDLPIALGYMIASDQLVFQTKNKLFTGELALDGQVRAVPGILPIADGARKMGFEEIYVPVDNALEASVIEGIKVFPVRSLNELVRHLRGEELIKNIEAPTHDDLQSISYKFDLSMVKGQQHAKRALEIAATGGHNILMSGVPGSGKTMLARSLPSILPSMSTEESLEVTRIYSVSSMINKRSPVVKTRPFRSPHHTSSQVALVGGGAFPRPGEISLAHRGVLFLDEFPEFSTQALESLRQPLEDRIVTISRAQGSITFPANFILVAAMNPCRCGFKGDPIKQCTCSTNEVLKYQKKISGPILDRIDLLINVPKVDNSKLFSTESSENSATTRERVERNRILQRERYSGSGIFCNAEMSQEDISKFVNLNESSKRLLNLAVEKMNLSARSYFRVLRVARTIADMESMEAVGEEHIAEALSYRVEIG